MSMYIFSTLTASQKYPIWVRTKGHDIPRIDSYVLVHGGANLPSKVLVTPRGVMTTISDEEYDRLKDSPGFKQHVENGFLTVEDKPHDPDNVAGEMQPKDTSAPTVPEDFEKAGQKPPTTGDATIEEPNASTVSSTQRPAQAAVTEKAATDAEKPARRRRGRPPGSKNKTEAEKTETAGTTETAENTGGA